jgi:hypothetical protein
MNDELERIWKEEFMVYSRYSPSSYLEVVSEIRRTLVMLACTPSGIATFRRKVLRPS